MDNNASYSKAGVNIDAGNALVDAIKPLAKSTSRLGADTNLGGFGGLFDLKPLGYRDPVLVSSTDGVGTKLRIAINCQKYDTVGIDLVAMCVNDIIVQGAEPLFFLDYFATGKLEVESAAAVISGIAEGCRQAACALIGGETAEMPGMYHGNDFDLAGFSVGVAERDALLPKATIQAGDVVLGIASSGVHSNGFSLVRHVLDKENIQYSDKVPFAPEKTFGEMLLTPTIIYVKSCLAAIKAGGVKGLSHITGGGLLENIPRVLPEGLAASLSFGSWEMLPIFTWLKQKGNITAHEMLRTFNCGVGMVVIVSADKASAVSEIIGSHGQKVFTIGEIVKQTGDEQVVVQSLGDFE